MRPPSPWHDPKRGFGLHYDLHAGPNDKTLGTRCTLVELVPMLNLLDPDFVQTDCKGHAGYLSWFSQVPEASIPAGLTADALAQWRSATAQLGLPLHCHYSGIWDRAAGEKHPDWCVVPANPAEPGTIGQNAGAPSPEKMCPRGPYLEMLMIPQLLELIDRYHVDGFWIDGDLWAVEPCYCDRCRAAFAEQTGIGSPPIEITDPAWPRWWRVSLESFEAYVTKYCEAVHQYKPGVLICSNWLQTFRNPGEPKVPTDWISGDNTWVWGMDASRCEARFLSTRGKHWDIMLWSFYRSHDMSDPRSPWTFKPPAMLMQEAAVSLAFGGAVQIYETSGVRDGRLVPWRVEALAEVGRFIKSRWEFCRGSDTIPQIAVLHSEVHARATVTGKNLMWSVDTAPVQGAVFALLESHFGVDILDEWALIPRLAEFPVVVVPEQHEMSAEMAAALKDYVEHGGRLLVTGSKTFDVFDADFLGAVTADIQEKRAYLVPSKLSGKPAGVPLYSEAWRLLTVTSAESLGDLTLTPLLDDLTVSHPAAILNQVGQGSVAYIPADVCRDFDHNRYPMTRVFLGEIIHRLAGRFEIEVQAPTAIDVVLRRQNEDRVIHLINRGSGIPNSPNNGAIDEIPSLGPVIITVRMPEPPAAVELLFEDGPLEWSYFEGELSIRLAEVDIHSAVVIE